MASHDNAVRTRAEQEYEGQLQERGLVFQECHVCAFRWLPPMDECPSCWTDDYEWATVSGAATLVSWVRYRVDLGSGRPVPYVIGVADLAEGPRAVGEMDSDTEWKAGDALRVVLTRRDDRPIVEFHAG